MFSNYRAANQRTEIDRKSWAELSQLIVDVAVEGSGTIATDPIEFSSVFTSQPFFSYGVQLSPGEVLVDGDYPLVSAGVSEWNQNGSRFIGCTLYVSVLSQTSYKLNLKCSFEGVAFKSNQYLR